MSHSLLLRTALASGTYFEPARARVLQLPLPRLMQALKAWTPPGYRPERHYMRGGRTPGAKSLLAR